VAIHNQPLENMDTLIEKGHYTMLIMDPPYGFKKDSWDAEPVGNFS